MYDHCDNDNDWNGIVVVVDGVGNDEWNGKYVDLILHFFFVFFLLLFNVSHFYSSFFSWSSYFVLDSMVENNNAIWQAIEQFHKAIFLVEFQ